MISPSCFACMEGLHRVVGSAINSDSGNFHSVYQTQQFHKSCQKEWWFIVWLDGQHTHHLRQRIRLFDFLRDLRLID